MPPPPSDRSSTPESGAISSSPPSPGPTPPPVIVNHKLDAKKSLSNALGHSSSHSPSCSRSVSRSFSPVSSPSSGSRSRSRSRSHSLSQSRSRSRSSSRPRPRSRSRSRPTSRSRSQKRTRTHFQKRHRSPSPSRSTSPRAPRSRTSFPNTTTSSHASLSPIRAFAVSQNGNSPDSKRPGPRPSQSQLQPQPQKLPLSNQEKTGGDTALNLLTRTGGAYIPPAKLRALQDQITDKSSEAYQRITWEALKKSINGLINKANTSNLKNIIPELISENLIRGRGLFCRSIVKSQYAALPFTPVYAALVAVINTKFPQIGEMLCARLITQFRRSYRRNDKPTCLSSSTFIAHLVNHRVLHELVALQILTLLVERPSDDSVEIAVGFIRECGHCLTELQPRAVHVVFDRFRAILHEASNLELRTQYMIEVLFQLRKEKFKDHPSVLQDLDLVEEQDQITHFLSLDDEVFPIQDEVNVFQTDTSFLENEERYKQIKHEILGSSDSESGSEAHDSGSEENDEDEDENSADDEEGEGEEIQGTGKSGMGHRLTGGNLAPNTSAAAAVPGTEGIYGGLMPKIIDETHTDIISLRKLIYLTIMSSLDFEECCHKLMKLNIHPDNASELANMIVECCSQERTYMKFYGLMAERFCKVNRVWTEEFCKGFVSYYDTIHRFETGPLRNVAKLFAHVLASDAIPWSVFQCVRLTEETTTSASRIFVKILFQELLAHFGITKLLERLRDPFLREHYENMFPKDHPRHTRFAINFWTSIGLGAVTDELREWLKTAPKLVAAQPPPETDSSDSSSASSSSEYDSDSDSSGSYTGSSGSDSDNRRSRSRSASPYASPRPRSRA